MPFNSVAQVADAVEQGRQHIQHFLRTSLNGGFGIGTTFGDASVGNGVPIYNPYLGPALESTQLIGNRNASIYVGPGISTERYLLSVALTQAGASGFFPAIYFLDYLLFYSYVDLDSTDEQIFTNTVGLPRYTNGEGVRMALVMQTPGTGAGATATINYTNSDGAAKTVSAGVRSSGAIGVNASANNAVATTIGPFLPLADGDKGVQSVQSIQLGTSLGGGFAVLLLAKPLFTLAMNELQSTVEKNFLREQAALPRIYDGAFLNYMFNLSANTSAVVPVIGQAQFIWTE